MNGARREVTNAQDTTAMIALMRTDPPDPLFARHRQQLEHLLLRGSDFAEAVLADVHYVLWEVCQACGDPRAAAAHLDLATRIRPLRTRLLAGASPCRSVLLLAAPGDFQANLPLDLLLDGRTLLHTLRIRDPAAVLADPRAAFGHEDVPPFDCVMIAIAEAAERVAHLHAADALAAFLGKPVLNRGDRIARLSRIGAATILAGITDAIVPFPTTMCRAALLGTCPDTPFLLRPAASHAGRGLHRIANNIDLAAALANDPEEELFVATPYVDYRGADGLYRKYRIVFVDRRPFPVHLAIHDDWAVWYYNARMDCFPARRDEEAAFLDAPDKMLPPRARRALDAIAERIGLDYFGLDCGLLGDGRLLVFEIETGMIVHDRDPVDLFPAKAPAARRVAAALEHLIDRRVTLATG